VLVNSDWSRQNLLNESVNPAKIVVVPLCYEAEGYEAERYEAESRGLVSSAPTNDEHPLIVLWIGQIILRKGIQYLFEAARRMQKNRIRFIVAGHVGISAAALSSAPSNVEILGRVPRTKALELFNAADVFALPTVSDGFALTQLEAMSFGLPVITTSHCGAVVTDGADGYIIPSGNVEALVEKIEMLDRDRALLNHMKTNARLKPKEHRFTLDGYATAVETAMQRVRQEQLSK
jgi:glycosyltransferase involved in cell wall biosynthesis